MLLPVVLIISDDISKTQFLKKTLKGRFHILERSKASLGLETAKSTILDVVLIDSKIPDMSVVDICRAIRKIAAYFETPILIITSNLKKTFTNQVLQAGATGFLNEPLDPTEIDLSMAVALRTKQREKIVSEMGTHLQPQMPEPQRSLSKRVSLTDEAIREIAKAREMARLLSLLMIQLDNSPSEETVVQFTAILQENLRQADILIPQSHGKFIIILPKTSKRAAQIIAETIRSEISKAMPITVSIGVISFDPSLPSMGSAAEEFDHLLEGVSRAVNEAKKTGNRVITEEP